MKKPKCIEAHRNLGENMTKPLVVELFAGHMTWSAGWLALGGRAVGFDIEHLTHHGPVPSGAELVLQDVRTLHGSQFKDTSLILCSPPCTEFSYMAMPWKRAKQIARALRSKDEFPEGYTGSRTIPQLTALFDACFQIQREASEAAGWPIPMVVENVKGAQPWVGSSKWHYGSYYLWGDVPALMPITRRLIVKNGASTRDEKYSLTIPRGYGFKNARNWWSNGSGTLSATTSSKSNARKAASAAIAKIPYELSLWIAKCYYPHDERTT